MHLFKESLIGQALCAFTYYFILFFHWQTDKKRAWENMCREKPNVVQDREHEKTYRKLLPGETSFSPLLLHIISQAVYELLYLSFFSLL